MPTTRRPRRGSLQYWPRKRAKRIYPRINWEGIKKNMGKDDLASILGFASYKVGMTHVQYQKGNRSIVKPATILEAPPLFVFGIRFYGANSLNELNPISEICSEKLPKDLERKIGKKSKKKEFDEKVLEKTKSIRLVVCTQPTKSGMHKKKPEVFEIGISGSVEKQYELAKKFLGKEINIYDVFRNGDFCDVSAVTKGHGFVGSVKRFGIKIQGRKDEQHHRHVGSIGPTTPRRIDWRVPMPGQYGFFTRTEFNKRILLLGKEPSDINNKSGYEHYGVLRSNYVLVEGSVPGPRKRLIILTKSRRKSKYEPVEIKYIDK